jgi:methylated-DNA-protein-cysteine methyltransferase-like protein
MVSNKFYNTDLPGSSSKYPKIWETIKKIPRGHVATYGQIARLSGFGGHARLVGYALYATPAQIKIPWHRVINARGKISLPKEDGRYDLQKTLLEVEGIVFRGERVNLKKYQWNPVKKNA